MGAIAGPETSVSNHLTPRNSPEGGRIQFNHGESLRSRIQHAHCTVRRTSLSAMVFIRVRLCTVHADSIQLSGIKWES